jgi:hypothetical protein
VRTAALPEAERPKAITAALADVDAAPGRLGEVEEQQFEAHQRQMQLRRQRHSVVVDQEDVGSKEWEEAQRVSHEAQDDLALVQEVQATAEQAVSEARQALAETVVNPLRPLAKGTRAALA